MDAPSPTPEQKPPQKSGLRKMSKVIGVGRNKQKQLIFACLFENDQTPFSVPNTIMKIHYQKELLDYYESKIILKE